jgi:hypothetical protein
MQEDHQHQVCIDELLEFGSPFLCCTNARSDSRMEHVYSDKVSRNDEQDSESSEKVEIIGRREM